MIILIIDEEILGLVTFFNYYGLFESQNGIRRKKNLSLNDHNKKEFSYVREEKNSNQICEVNETKLKCVPHLG